MATLHLAKRMSRLGSESAFEVLARARALEAKGREIVHLEIGEPDFDTPEHIVEAGCRALREGATHYTAPEGIPELREAIAEHISERRGHDVHPDQVVVTPGAKPIMFFVLLALAEPGREVVYPDPGFPIYRSVIDFCGAKPVPLPLEERFDFGFDPERLDDLVGDDTALVILNSPHNPTGGVLSEAQLSALAAVCRRHDVPVLSDEIYEDLVYGETFHSVTSVPGMFTDELGIILHGFSKAYAMTGWRLGYGVMPRELAQQIKELMINSNSCTNAATQWAGIAALEGSQEPVREMEAAFDARRHVLVEGLNRLPGVSCKMPKGAFYAFPNISGTGMTSQECADFFLETAGVACLAGSSFGDQGEGFLRLSYANSIGNLEKALKRMDYALRNR